MPHSFDLTREPWIPCVMADGRFQELGIEDVLVRAHEIREISDDSPLATIAIHRLLLAILHRIFGPRDEDQWTEIWTRGRFDARPIHEYLGHWRERFDLFHPDRPFYQIPDPGELLALAPVNRLGLDLASGNNPTLFSHHLDAPPPAIEPRLAVRWLLSIHLFHPGGLVTPDAGSRDRSAEAAPLQKAAVIMPAGTNLFETLALCLVYYEPSADQPFEGQSPDDAPAWEQDQPAQKGKRDPTGYLDYMTWQSRRIFLKPQEENGRLVVRQAVLADGWRFANFSLLGREQMVAHQRGQKDFEVLGFRADRAFWRDSLALFESTRDDAAQQTYLRPPVMNFLAGLAFASAVIEPARILRVFVGGLCGKQAKIHFWRAERMPLPLGYLGDQDLIDNLADALGRAEEAGDALSARLRQIAYYFDSEHPAQRAQAFPSLRYYWERLGHIFPRFLVELAKADDRAAVLRRWHTEVRRAAIDALQQTLRALPDNHDMLRLGAQTRRQLLGRLKQIIPG